jgi:hypothetical protein
LTVAVVFILAVLWIAVLAPPILRARDQQARGDSVGAFHYQLGVLGRANGTNHRRPDVVVSPMLFPVSSGSAMTSAQRRRRDVLVALAGACALTLLLAVVTRMTPMFAVNLLADALFGTYVYLLVQHKRRVRERRTKVRYLSDAHAYRPSPLAAGPAIDRAESSPGPRLIALRRSASS